MKKSLLTILCSVFMLFISIFSEAQIPVTIGTGTTTNTTTTYPAPYGNWYFGARHQFMVKPSELLAAGATPGFISSLAFNVATVFGTALTDFTIKMGSTTDTVMSTTTGFYTTMNQVYTVASYTEVAGWNVHPFTTNFFWDGTSSLIIETCFNNTAFTSNASTFWTNVGYNASLYFRSDATGVCANPLITAVAQERPNMQLSFLPNTGRDLGTVQLLSPQPLALGSNQVTARFASLAADTIVSANIGYQLNNDPPVTVTGHTFAAPLTAGQGENVTFATPLNITANGTYTLKVWNSNANGLGADNNTANDTLVRTLCTSLSGSYTVGGSLADYPSVSAAVAALNNCGINGPVTFLINDGTYYGGYTLANIIGAGGTNAINFISASSNPANVILIHDTVTPVAGSRHHFVVNGIPNVSFNSLTFRRTLDGTALSAAILYENGANFGAVSNCIFDDQTGGGNFNSNGIRINASSFTSVLNNTFTNFYYAVYLVGTSANSTYSEGTQVIANTFIGYRYAVYLTNTSGSTVSGNQLQGINASATSAYGIYYSRAAATTTSDNTITGKLGNAGIYLFNMNTDSLGNENRVFNNVISGTADATPTIITYGIYFAGSFNASPTAIPLNPLDQVTIVNNTINIAHVSTSTFNFGAIHLTGGSGTTPAVSNAKVLNNNVFLYPMAGAALPTNLSPMWITGTVLRDSLVSNYNNLRIVDGLGATAINPLVREATTTFATIAAWSAASSRDSNSVSITPDFIAPTLPIPTSLALDNKGTPIPYIFTDIAGTARSATTPDIGAHEFVGLQFSQITLTQLADTLVSTGRLLTVNIQDSTGLILGPPNGPRLYYSKNSSGLWEVDSTPVVTGNNFTFSINYATLGGVLALDTIRYYVATLNNGGTVTTSPLGGSGTGPIGNVVPPIVYNYKLLGQAAGNYRVGVSGPADFPTIRSAVNFLANSLITGPVTFTLIDTLYNAASGETFPYTIAPSSGLSAINNVKIRLDSSLANVSVVGSNASAIFVLNSMQHFEMDGGNVAGGRGLTIVNNSVAANSAVIYLLNTTLLGNEFITLKNMNVVAGSNTVTSTFGITGQGTAVSTFGAGDRMANITIQNIGIRRAYFGIYLRGTALNPATNIIIANNTIGDASVAATVNFKGIDVQNVVNAQVRKNEIFNITGTNNTTRTGIELGGTASSNVRVTGNLIYDVNTPFTNSATGIAVISGNGFVIDNNVIRSIRTLNGSTSQFSNAFGIRLSSGSGHKVWYNTVHMYGDYANANTVGTSSAALVVTSTIVTNIEIKNNVFSNTMTSVATGSRIFTAVWLPTSYAASSLDINNNAYHVANTIDHAVGRVGTLTTGPFYDDVLAWKGFTSGGTATNDILSVPPTGKSPAPFVSDTVLTIPATTVTGMESGAVVITALGTPNTDFNNVNRPAGTGIAPDMGAYEFEGVVLPDAFPPTIDSAYVTPLESQCVVTPRTMTAFVSDNAGGVGVDSVFISYTVATLQQPLILMSRTAGTAASGTYTGTIPAAAGPNLRYEIAVVARDSNGNFAPLQTLGTYADDYLAVNAGNDTTIIAGDTATLIASVVGFAGTNVVEASRTGGNGSAGVSFNVRAISGVVLDSIYVPIYGTIGTAATVDIWHSTSAVNGAPSITTGAVWTRIVTAGSTTCLNTGFTGAMLGSAVAIPGNLTIPAGTTHGFFVQVMSGGSQGYTSHTTALVDTFTDGNIVVYTGPNVGYGGSAPNPTFHPRMFNGSVGYKSNASVTWTELGSTTVLASSDTLLATPIVTTTYVATLTDSICTKTDTVTVFVTPNIIDDIGIGAILSPTAVSALNQAYTVTVVIENFGNAPATGFDVAFAVNGAELNANPIARTVAAGDTIHHTFTQSWSPTLGGTVELCAYTKGLSTDVNLANDTSCATFLNVNVEEVNNLVSKVYPVPADQFVNFDFGAQQGTGMLELRDNLGRLVYSTPIDLSTGAMHEVKTGSYAAGVYNYRFVTDSKVQYGQVVVRR